MALPCPGERRFKALVRRNDHDARVIALLRLGPQRVYAGLLWVQRDRNYNRGWIGHAFRELYGTWPRPRDEGAPMRPSSEFEEWLASRKPKRKPR